MYKLSTFWLSLIKKKWNKIPKLALCFENIKLVNLLCRQSLIQKKKKVSSLELKNYTDSMKLLLGTFCKCAQ